MKKQNLNWLVLGVSLLLVACERPAAPTSAAPSVAAADAVDPLAKYVGTWVAACEAEADIVDRATQQAAHVILEIAVTRPSDTTLQFTPKYTVYASADTHCQAKPPLGVLQAGGPRGTLTSGLAGITADGNVMAATYDGQAEVAGKTVEKFKTAVTQFSSVLPSNTTLTGGAGSQFQIRLTAFEASAMKQIFYINGNTLAVGDSTNAAAYPIALQASVFTKR